MGREDTREPLLPGTGGVAGAVELPTRLDAASCRLPVAFYFCAPARAAGDEAAIQAYFDTYNAAIAETPWDGAGPRQVTWVMKVTAFERDNWKCVVCGSDGPLELDHARALMNGGDNTLENLHTLCHDCHVAKTRLDFALRRHRQDLAPETLPPDPEATSETRHAQSPE